MSSRRIVLEYTTGRFAGLRQIQGELLSVPEAPLQLNGVALGEGILADFNLVKQGPRYVQYAEIPSI